MDFIGRGFRAYIPIERPDVCVSVWQSVPLGLECTSGVFPSSSVAIEDKAGGKVLSGGIAFDKPGLVAGGCVKGDEIGDVRPGGTWLARSE